MHLVPCVLGTVGTAPPSPGIFEIGIEPGPPSPSHKPRCPGPILAIVFGQELKARQWPWMYQVAVFKASQCSFQRIGEGNDSLKKYSFVLIVDGRLIE